MSDSTFSVQDTSLDVLIALAQNEHAPKELRLAAVTEALTRPLARVEEDAKVTRKRLESLERLRDELSGVYFGLDYNPHAAAKPVVQTQQEHRQSGPPAPKVKFVPPSKEFDSIPLEAILRARNIRGELLLRYGVSDITKLSGAQVLHFLGTQGIGHESPITKALLLARDGFELGGNVVEV